MIRKFIDADTERVLEIWLEASVNAHNFVKREFWESKIDDMKELYLPGSETYVYEENGEVKGFFSLVDETLAALFVAPDRQGQGCGKKLIAKAKELRPALKLTVYSKNTKSVDFYRKCGFKTVKEQTDKHTGETELMMEYIRFQVGF
ncbi:MAG: N-acetyltransferase [Victivallaceae bacterium]